MSCRILVVLLTIMLGSGLVLPGCGGSDDTPTGPVDPTNSLVVNPSPDSLNAPWTLAGPDGYTHSGNGDATLTNLEAGEYWIVWGEITGYFTPAQSNQILAEEGTVTFICVYELIGSGTVVIDPSPDEINAPWTLTGPDSFTQSGTGDSTLPDLIPGQYTLTWDELTGWIRPAAATEALVADATITFSGTYLENSGTGTVVIDPHPVILNAPWTLHGPDGYVNATNGFQTLNDMVAGEYTLVWGDLSGWITPPTADELLLADGMITFTATYEEEAQIPGFQLLPPAQVSMPVGFFMGGKDGDDEFPHSVTLTHRFYMGEYEVTNGQYVELLQWAYNNFYVFATPYSVTDNLDSSSSQLVDLEDEDCQIEFNSGIFSTPYPDRPVIDLTWYGAAAYCDWLNMFEGFPRAYNHANWRCNNFQPYEAEGYRLPTEAEWELSCRAGTLTPFSTGECLDGETEANYNFEYPYTGCPAGTAVGHTVEVGSYPANPWGLYDMHGNVFEWCNDRYGPYEGMVTDPVGPITGNNRVIRGGAFSFEAIYCRSAARSSYAETYFSVGTGFRVARSAN